MIQKPKAILNPSDFELKRKNDWNTQRRVFFTAPFFKTIQSFEFHKL